MGHMSGDFAGFWIASIPRGSRGKVHEKTRRVGFSNVFMVGGITVRNNMLTIFTVLLVCAFILMAIGSVADDSEDDEAVEESVEEPEEDIEEPETETEPEPETEPESVTYEGSGDDILAIEPTEPGPMILNISGNQDGRHFAVESFDANGNELDLLVNVTEPYEGMVYDLGEARELDISAVGSWTVEVEPLRAATEVVVPGKIEGSGDYVFLLDGEPSEASISGNQDARHFAVEAYNQGSDLLVNTTDPYEGRVRIREDAKVVVMYAVGEWTIEFE